MPRNKELMVPLDFEKQYWCDNPPEAFSLMDLRIALKTVIENREKAKRHISDDESAEESPKASKRRCSYRSSLQAPYLEPTLTPQQNQIITETVNSVITKSEGEDAQDSSRLLKDFHTMMNALGHYSEDDKEWQRYLERCSAGMPDTPGAMLSMERQERSLVFMKYRALRRVYPITLEKFYTCYCALSTRKLLVSLD